MFGSPANRANAYAQVAVETGVSTADPHKLILMLFDGALLQVRTAGISMQSGDIPAKGMAISKAIEIIINGLKVSLDTEAGGELADRLSALYDYMSERLLYANLHNNPAALKEVSELIVTLREAWASISDQAQSVAA
ncbi:MAG: flagellar export chaperone FliS [Azoarcus sp.]|nr:flagellar export chaperone FliS [Azoarcus sp.]PKO56710.1 MAG: flagellar export chaperone FliS [Betaproteobacteria bacterium HGW-Betaproteobacteria-21]